MLPGRIARILVFVIVIVLVGYFFFRRAPETRSPPVAAPAKTVETPSEKSQLKPHESSDDDEEMDSDSDSDNEKPDEPDDDEETD